MPLTRLYRLGPSPQRIGKGYVIAGPADRVLALRRELAGRAAARDVTVEVPEGSPRAITLRTGWWWLHDRDSRDAARSALTEAAVRVASAARNHGCLLLPGAVRPAGEAAWQDWTTGDDHSIVLLDDVEREVATNLFRSHVPEIIALTGHPGIGPAPEPLGSRRLAESGQHLATRYLASASGRHLSLVESELRRTTGIRDLRTMDVHPLDEPGPGGAGGSLGVRCVDGQAFAGTAVAHAILLQALAMAARRTVRDGRREGNTDQRLLERRRAAAVLKGIDARVQTESVVSRGADGKNSRHDSGRVSLDVLALELLDTLVPELGTLEASFAEFAPVIAWTAMLTESATPRTEAELLARALSGARGASHEVIAGMVAAPDWHAPDRFLSGTSLTPARLRELAQQWEARLTEPPPGTAAKPRNDKAGNERPRGERPRNDKPANEKPANDKPANDKPAARPQWWQDRPDSSDPATKPHRKPDTTPAGKPDRKLERVQRIAGLPEGEPSAHVGLIAALAGELQPPSAELVPWLGPRHRDLVTTARRRLRPAGECQVSCSPAQLRAGSPKVDQVSQVASDKGIGLLRASAAAADRQSLVDAATGLVTEAGGPCRFVLLAVNSFKRGDEEAVSVDLLVLPKKGLA